MNTQEAARPELRWVRASGDGALWVAYWPGIEVKRPIEAWVRQVAPGRFVYGTSFQAPLGLPPHVGHADNLDEALSKAAEAVTGVA